MKDRLLHIFILLTLSFSANAQLLTEYDDFGISIGSNALIGNSNDWILNDLNYDLSIGLYYDFVNSDFYSIPVYIQYTRSQINLIEGQEIINPNYLDIEFAYRRHIIFNIGSRIYVEGGINSRVTLGDNVFKNSLGTEYEFKRFSIIPKIAVGIELSGKQKPFVYLNIEYWNSLSGYLTSVGTPLNKYVGLRASFPIIQ